MKKVDNEIQKELSYNYHTAFEADRIINMTEYFDEPPKKSNPFAKLSPSICVVAFTAIVLMVSVLSIYLFNGRKILVNTKYEKDDRKKLEQISKLYYYDLFDKYNISYYCFLKNEDDWGYGNKNQTPEEKQQEFESLGLKSDVVLNLFHNDLEGEKNSKNLLLVLPAGKAAHIEAGIAYGLGKKCYAIGEYEATDTLYNIFQEIFSNEDDLEQFLKEYSNI